MNKTLPMVILLILLSVTFLLLNSNAELKPISHRGGVGGGHGGNRGSRGSRGRSGGYPFIPVHGRGTGHPHKNSADPTIQARWFKWSCLLTIFHLFLLY
ncbi:hypothetical protein ACH5RR_032466 [Cinchona calisaya]|uniref:Glycine-rich protein n=1 Tax=Cinchona calisaya TaxID=153742 RepID=A0ABD2YMA6_9GENT